MAAEGDVSSPIPARRRTVSLFLWLVSVITYFAFSAKARAASYQTALQAREHTVPPRTTPTPLARHFSVSVRTIHSFGQPRSGSTFQFVLLCVIAHLRSDSVSCAGEPARLRVIKAHPRNMVLKLSESSMLFTTARDSDIWKRTNVTWEGRPVSYTQDYFNFTRCALCEIHAYTEIFNLTKNEIFQLTQYMRYWSILRQCCGSQMSKWFRGELFGCPYALDIQGRTDYHMCSAFNLTAVEEIFERTSLYTKVPASRLSEERHLKYNNTVHTKSEPENWSHRDTFTF
jgi:hypothetical protein